MQNVAYAWVDVLKFEPKLVQIWKQKNGYKFCSKFGQLVHEWVTFSFWNLCMYGSTFKFPVTHPYQNQTRVLPPLLIQEAVTLDSHAPTSRGDHRDQIWWGAPHEALKPDPRNPDLRSVRSRSTQHTVRACSQILVVGGTGRPGLAWRFETTRRRLIAAV